MATRPVVPRATGEGSIGTDAKHWGAGYFDNLSLAGEDVAGTLSNMDLALAESTGYGIVSGCEPSISGLTVTVGAGIVHLADGTRKELSATNITLDAADTTNPRIDLVYIGSTGTVAKVTGTAAASPVVPALPTGGISVAQVSVAAGATTGTLTDNRKRLYPALQNKKCWFLFPASVVATNHGDCQIVKTEDKNLMIDAGAVGQTTADYIISYCLEHDVKKIDYFLLTHYHLDHYNNIQYFIAQSDVDFSETIWLIPPYSIAEEQTGYNAVKSWLTGKDYREVTSEMSFTLDDGVSVDLFNCNAEDRQHYIDTSADLNDFSIFALVKNGDVKVLYTGDGTGSTNWLYSNGKYERVNIIKAPHHGVAGVPNYFYMYHCAPDVALFNLSLDEATTLNNDIGTVSDCQNVMDEITHGNIRYLMLGSAEWLSLDGKNLIETSKNNTRVNRNPKQATVVNFYVDSTTENEICDGSSQYPFRTIAQAINLSPDNKCINTRITLNNTTYNSDIFVINRVNPLTIIANPNGTSVNAMLISTSANVALDNNFTMKRFFAERSKIFCGNNCTITVNATAADSCYVGFGAQVRFKYLAIDCSGFSYTSNTRALFITGGTVYIDRNVTFNNCGIAIDVKESGILGASAVNATNVSKLFYVDNAFGAIQVLNNGTRTNVTTAVSGLAKFIDVPDNR